jgi:hypothetical protein
VSGPATTPEVPPGATEAGRNTADSYAPATPERPSYRRLSRLATIVVASHDVRSGTPPHEFGSEFDVPDAISGIYSQRRV